MAADKTARAECTPALREAGASESLPAEALGDGFRILIYSHDSFGLGHLRRCRAIAHALVEHRSNLSVLILSGSPIIGSFDFRSRVDFVRVPGVIKLRNGEYTALNLHIGLQQTLAIRASIIRHTAEVFAPHLFLVDKEPLGLRGEIEETLAFLKERRTPLVLGLRDVIDEPELLQPEWERKNAVPALSRYYDSIWVYGLPQICDPLAGLRVPKSVRRKMVYTGYLHRDLPTGGPADPSQLEDPYILVTPGGGGDGEALVDWVLRVYEQRRTMPLRAVIVTGPFMQADKQAEFQQRAAALHDVSVTTFDAAFEHLISGAEAVVAMGGYNTFCEVLSFDKRALLVPRTVPRREQFIRACQAQEAGLLTMLEDDGVRDVDRMATALRQLPQQNRPSDVIVPGLLDGLDNVNRLVGRIMDTGPRHVLPGAVKAA
ncbi:MAG: glycosyltransferase [Rhodospirillaceae bacterium]|nr:glycosyltransferase [Rhodospirillaceae bacterium]